MNEPQIDGGVDTLAANIVGKGITPRWQIENGELKKDVQALWSDWVKTADADGLTDFYGLQTLAVRAIIESGEVLVHDRYRRRDSGLLVPYQLQLLEGDHLDETFTTVNPDNGNTIRFGIEFNNAGRRVAYHLFKEHPAEMFLFADNSARTRVLSKYIQHIFKPLRPGQKRGRPWLSSIIVAMHELGKYDDAELVRKSAAAMFGGFIVSNAGNQASGLGLPVGTDANNQTIVAMEPGTFPKLPTGMDVRFSTPADVGGNYEAFIKRQERRISRGFGGLSYEKFSGDLTDASYSSIRTGTVAEQRVWVTFISNVLIPAFCQPIAEKFLRQAIVSGNLHVPDFAANPQKYTRIKWCIDGWDWVDPEKDIKAEKLSIRCGIKSRSESASERGRDIEEIDAENKTDNDRADGLGLLYDTDPRNQDANGSNRDHGGTPNG